MTTRDWLVPSLTGLVCLAAGMYLASDPDNPDDVAQRRQIQPQFSNAARMDPRDRERIAMEISVDELRRVVREELAAHDASRARAVDAPREDAEQPTPAQVVATAEAQAVLDAALARRTWTNGDAEALRERIDELTADQRMELLRKFSVAVNQGHLVPQTDQIPF
jgi:hypothetical protein